MCDWIWQQLTLTQTDNLYDIRMLLRQCLQGLETFFFFKCGLKNRSMVLRISSLVIHMTATQRAELQTLWKIVKRKKRSSGLTSALGPSGSLQQAISFFTGTLSFTIWPTISRPRPLLAPVISTFTDCAAIFCARSCCSLLGL